MKWFIALVFLLSWNRALAETCTLETYASSWMATGTPFSVKCNTTLYTGSLITTPARRFFRRGHMMLKFDQPVMVHSNREGDEGAIQAGRGKQIASMLMDGGVGIGAKDLTDGLAGTVYKSWYAIPISFVALSFFSKGGDVNLKPGAKLDIISLRN